MQECGDCLKKQASFNGIILFALLTGALGLGLRLWARTVAVDERGLYLAFHPLYIAVGLFCAVALVGLVLLARRPVCLPAQAGALSVADCAVGGVGLICLAAVCLATGRDILVWIEGVSALLAGASVLWQGVSYLRRRPASPLAYLAPAVHFILVHPATQYRHWSSTAQLHRYLFSLLASLFLIFACYQRAALAARVGNPRRYVLFSQCAAFFCLLAAADEMGLFYLVIGLWMLFGLFLPFPEQPRKAA